LLADEQGRRGLRTRTMQWPECKGTNVWDCKAYIEEYISNYGGHVIANLELVVRQPRVQTVRVQTVFDESNYFNGIRSNLETLGQSSCDRFDGATVHRNSDNTDWSWVYSNGTNYTVPELDCFDKTNAECCDIIWEHGEWMGLDRDGRHLTCYVYQEPTYPFFDAKDNNLLKYSDYFNDVDGSCTKKNYRIAPLQRQYKKVADKIKTEVIQQINHFLEPTALTGFCADSDGNDQNTGFVALKRKKNFGPGEELKQECLQMCIDYQIANEVEVTGCEAIWRHGGRGCYAHTAEVVYGSGLGNKRACFVDPIRPTDGKLKCAALKKSIDSMYNYARMTYLNVLVGRIQFEHYHEFCSEGEEYLDLSVGLTNLLKAVRDRSEFTGELKVVNFIYIVGGLDGIVASTPRVASNNPALNPILWNSA
jgi:hypothetical protein